MVGLPLRFLIAQSSSAHDEKMSQSHLTSVPFRFLPSRHLKAAVLFLLTLSVLMPGLASGQTTEQDIETSFRAGQAALRQGDFRHAIEEFKKVLAVDPNLVEAQVNLGLAYQSLLEYEAAVHYLAPALVERPNLASLNVILGLDYLKLGQPDKAVPYLLRALELTPSSPDAHEAMAVYQLTRENFQGAVEQYRKIADLNSDKAEASFNLGHQYLDLAARLAYRGARLYPDSAWGHRFLGDMLFERDRWQDAAREYMRALAIEPRQAGLHTSLGEAYLHMGNLENAETEFRRELQLDPRYEQAWLGLANLQLAKGEALEALASVATVCQNSAEFLKARPEFPSFELTKEMAQTSIARLLDQPEGPAKHLLLSALYTTIDDNDRSDRELQSFQDELLKRQQTSPVNLQGHPDFCERHLYSRCITLLEKRKPRSYSADLLLGKTYFILQRYEPAAEALAGVHGDKNASSEASYWLERTYQALGAEAYAQLENSFPNSWRTHQLRAEGYALRGDHDNVIKEYQAALALRPNEAELHEAMGEFYLDNRSDDDARSELEKAEALSPSRTKTLYLLGRLDILDNHNDQAVPVLERALQLQPNLIDASELLGTAYMRMGKFAEAIPRLEKAAPLDHMGNVHFQLYQAYRKVGEAALAQKALARSQDIRRSSLERDQALIMGPRQVEPDRQ